MVSMTLSRIEMATLTSEADRMAPLKKDGPDEPRVLMDLIENVGSLTSMLESIDRDVKEIGAKGAQNGDRLDTLVRAIHGDDPLGGKSLAMRLKGIEDAAIDAKKVASESLVKLHALEEDKAKGRLQLAVALISAAAAILCASLSLKQAAPALITSGASASTPAATGHP